MSKKVKSILIVLLVIVAVVSIACGAYFITLKVQEKKALKTIDSMFTAIKSGDEEAIKQYINTEDESNDTNSEEASKEDSVMNEEAMTKAIVQNINYEVISTDTKINNCTVQLNVSNKNFKTIFGNYVSQAFSLTLSSAFGGMTEEEMNSKLEQYLIDQYNSDDVETVTSQIAMTVKKEDGKWSISCDNDEMVNALLPGYTETINSIDSTTQE